MNDVQAFIDRQLGFCNRLSYDSILRRLVVRSDESYYGLQNSMADASLEQDPPMFACRFAETAGYEHILALANEDGRVAIQDTQKSQPSTVLEGFQCHNNAVFDLAWRPRHMSFVTVSGDHTASLWDIQDGVPRRVSVFSSHTRSVKTAAFRPEQSAVFATGARDGSILLWDTRAPSGVSPASHLVLKPDNCLMNCHSNFTPKTPGSHSKRARVETGRSTSITGLVFQDDMTLISCGECDGNVKVWDLRKSYHVYKREPLPKHSIPYCGSSAKNGYTNLTLDDARLRLYASCMDDVIYCFNVATYSATPEQRYVGHENSTFYIKSCLSPAGRYLLSGSSDKHAYIWNVKHSQPVVRLAGHCAEVTCAAWCRAGGTKIVTCSDDARHKIWRIGNEFLSREDELELRGRAERVPRAQLSELPAWGGREGTPRAGKRARGEPPTCLERSKRPRSGQGRGKRCLAGMMNAAKEEDVLAKRQKCAPTPVPEPHVPEPHVLALEDRLLPCGTKRRLDAAPTTPTKRSCGVVSEDWSYISPRAGSSFMTPSKCFERRVSRKISPKGNLSPSPSRVVTFSTPTKNLPDFVQSGEAPHLRLMSPVKKKQETTNWLTLMTRDKKCRGEPPPAPLSPRDNLPPRRNSTTEKAPKSNVKTRTLLKYFNVSSKEK